MKEKCICKKGGIRYTLNIPKIENIRLEFNVYIIGYNVWYSYSRSNKQTTKTMPYFEFNHLFVHLIYILLVFGKYEALSETSRIITATVSVKD